MTRIRTDQIKKIQRAPKTKMNPKKRHGLHGSGRIRTDQVEKIRRASVSVRGNNFLSVSIRVYPWQLFFIREHQR